MTTSLEELRTKIVSEGFWSVDNGLERGIGAVGGFRNALGCTENWIYEAQSVYGNSDFEGDNFKEVALRLFSTSFTNVSFCLNPRDEYIPVRFWRFDAALIALFAPALSTESLLASTYTSDG